MFNVPDDQKGFFMFKFPNVWFKSTEWEDN